MKKQLPKTYGTKHRKKILTETLSLITQDMTIESALSHVYDSAYSEGQGVLASEMRRIKDKCPICGAKNETP